MQDLISRQAVIEINRSYHGQMPNEVNHRIWKEINELPSAQSTMGQVFDGDTISRAAAIDAHYEYCNKHPDAGFPVWSLKILEDLPSAQPEIIRCKDCKHSRFFDPCFYCYEFGGEIIVSENGYCYKAERRTDERSD